MDDEDLDSAARYRTRAEQLRMIADATKDAGHKGILFSIAEDYERMAASRERLSQMNRAMAGNNKRG